MPRTRTGRSRNGSARRRINGGVSSIRLAPRPRTAPVPPYARDLRWATPARPRNDVFIVDIADRVSAISISSDEDPLLLTA
jgi:hypothetical protein